MEREIDNKYIIENLIKILVKKGVSKKKISNKYNFVKSKDLDSLDIIQLIFEIEKKFTIKFKKNDLLKKEFNTIAGITNIILNKKR
jgi:acyl carrier protein|tara:strand:- start:202 stop:459 length:258 start_codon:yes stop_codon:yes gene_type:complete